MSSSSIVQDVVDLLVPPLAAEIFVYRARSGWPRTPPTIKIVCTVRGSAVTIGAAEPRKIVSARREWWEAIVAEAPALAVVRDGRLLGWLRHETAPDRVNLCLTDSDLLA